MKPTYTFLVSIVLSTVCVFADPQPGRDVSSMSESEVAELSREELMALPLEDLMILADKLGVSVDELLNLKISVSSKKALNTRESPGIISLITDEEIANSGARDLIDVLQLIPGFGFGYDFEGIIGIGMRGIWGHEGKMLLLIDGQEMNELLFSTQPYGHHFDVGQIKRIEIMRGPGSCVYGGFAELGVINIITKKADDLNGFSVKSTYGRMLDANARTNLSIGFGKFHEKVEYSVLGFANSSKRTDTPYESDYGLYDASSAVMNISSYNINASLGVNGVKTRFIFDYYSPYTVDLLDTLDIPTQESFSTYLGEIKYDWFINNSTTITPKINLKHQYAWRCLEPDPELYYNKSVTRMTGSILANHDFSDMLNVVGGIESFSDYQRFSHPL